MKVSVVIPTYWTSTSPTVRHQTQAAVYDHPTPLKSSNTLPRLLNSLKNTDIPKGSTIAVIVATTHKMLEEKARVRNREILTSYKDYFDIKQFSASTLKRINAKDQNLAQLLNLYGYSNVRNIGLAIAQILKSDMLVFLDDDIVVDDPRYFHKAEEFVGKNIDNKLLGGIAGYYKNEDGGYYLDVDPKAWWKIGWPKERKMNEAFTIIEGKQRLTETTFAFGGNMVIHWKMFEKVPFDPYITRGEDMDLIVNAEMFGFKFLLDTELKVLHLPGKGKSQWSEMRQDLWRFLYMRQKLLAHRNIRSIRRVSIDRLKPYPGHFLRSRAFYEFVASSYLNCLHSVLVGNLESLREFSGNIGQLPRALGFARKHCLDYFMFQKKWAHYMPKIRDGKTLKNILED